jgi:tRNA (guanine-N7-)-methyltransferase
MRIRNVKNAKEIIDNNPMVVKENPFNKREPLFIEIGCGKGNFIINMAKSNPHINFIGIEKYESIVVKALNKIEEIPSNLKFMCVDAINLDKYFKKNIDMIFLNFSDPWPKKKHAKRRLTSIKFLDVYDRISRNDVKIKMKTDNKGLFAYSLQSFNNNGYVFEELSLDLANEDIPNVLTEYEQKFMSMGITINYLYAIKKMHK